MRSNLKRPKVRFFFIAFFFLISSMVLFRYNPAGSILFPPCPFHALTGLYCPGCGSLRAVHQLFHGNLESAFGLNPLMIILLPFMGYAFISYAMMIFGKQRSAIIPASAYLGWLMLIVIVLYGIFRNIPYYPFTILAPSYSG
jgi:hypothetical protein